MDQGNRQARQIRARLRVDGRDAGLQPAILHRACEKARGMAGSDFDKAFGRPAAQHRIGGRRIQAREPGLIPARLWRLVGADFLQFGSVGIYCHQDIEEVALVLMEQRLDRGVGSADQPLRHLVGIAIGDEEALGSLAQQGLQAQPKGFSWPAAGLG